MTAVATPSIQTNTIATYILQATGTNNGLLFPNGTTMYSGAALADLIPPQSIGFSVPGNAKLVYVDNNTPCAIFFPEVGALISPFQMGVSFICDPETQTFHLQGQLTEIWTVGAQYTLSVRYSKKPGTNQGGAAVSTAVLAILTDSITNIYSAYARSLGAGSSQPNPLYTIGGYSPDAPDETWYHPARDANVKLWINQGLAGTSGHLTLYTPPAGLAVRLLWIEASVNVFTNTNFWLEEGNPAVRRLTPSNANFNANGTGMIVYRSYPHNGPTLATNAVLALGYVVPANTVLDLTAGLYVGP